MAEGQVEESDIKRKKLCAGETCIKIEDVKRTRKRMGIKIGKGLFFGAGRKKKDSARGAWGKRLSSGKILRAPCQEAIGNVLPWGGRKKGRCLKDKKWGTKQEILGCRRGSQRRTIRVAHGLRGEEIAIGEKPND